jgi:hypothetical protein
MVLKNWMPRKNISILILTSRLQGDDYLQLTYDILRNIEKI